MKRSCSIISILLCLILLLVTAAGCNVNQARSSPETDDTSQSTASDKESSVITYNGSAPVSEEPLTISWLCNNSGTTTQDMNFEDMGWCQEILKRANVKLEIEVLNSSVYNDAVLPRLAAGTDLPDVIQLPSKDTDMSFINSGIFINLSEMYEKYGFNLRERFKDNPTVSAQITTYDNKKYYVPVINMSIDYVPSISIHTRWIEKLNLQIPSTTDDYYNVMKAFKDNDPNDNGENDEIPVAIIGSSQMQRFGSMWGLDLYNGFMVNDEGKVEFSYVSEKFIEFVNYWNKMYKEGLLYNEFASATNDIIKSHFSKDCIGSTFYYPNLNDTYSMLIDPNMDPFKDKMIMSSIEPLKGPYGEGFYIGNDPIAGFFGITKYCENPEAVFCFLDYLFSEEANTLLYFGIEGIDYDLVNSEIVINTEVRDGSGNYSNRMGYNFGGFPRILLAIHRDKSVSEEIAESNQRIRNYVKLPIPSTFFLPDEVEIVQKYQADLKTYWREMFVSFITGTEDISNFDTFVKTINSMGVDELIEVYQAAQDRIESIK